MAQLSIELDRQGQSVDMSNYGGGLKSVRTFFPSLNRTTGEYKNDLMFEYKSTFERGRQEATMIVVTFFFTSNLS